MEMTCLVTGFLKRPSNHQCESVVTKTIDRSETMTSVITVIRSLLKRLRSAFGRRSREMTSKLAYSDVVFNFAVSLRSRARQGWHSVSTDNKVYHG